MITEIRNLVARVCGLGRLVSETQGLGIPLSEVGFPIRKFTDQSLFAAPRDLSQRSTSFIASQRQGIHRMPLRHLIALIINAHSTRRGDRGGRGRRDQALIRKTSLLRDRSDVRAVKQRTTCTLARDIQRDLSVARNVTPRCWRLRGRAGMYSRPNARSDLLFTMSENTHAASDDATGERCVLPDEHPAGGARRDRTDDLLLAKQALSQLSYGPAARNACNHSYE